MSRPQHFLEADSSLREQNLRFVHNNLEDNINQFFGGGGGVGGNGRPSSAAPPRNFKIVQPSPEFEQRKEFFLQLGLSRSEAVSLSNRSFCSEQFNINYFREKRHQLRKSRLKQTEADAKIVNEISVTIAELERQASNFGGGFNDRRDGGNFGGGFDEGNHGVFNGPRGSASGGGGNPENFNSIGGPVGGSFVGRGPVNFNGRDGSGAGRDIGFPNLVDIRGGGFQENLNRRSDDGVGILDSRGRNSNRNLGDRALDGPGNYDGRIGNAGNFDGRTAAPGIWDDKRGGGQHNFDRNFVGKFDSDPGNFGNRGDDGGSRNFNNSGDGTGNFGNMGDGGYGNFGKRGDGPGNFGNRINCGPENFGNFGDGGPGNFGSRGDGPENFGSRGDGSGNFGNRGDGPGNFGNRGDGPGNFGNRADGNHGNFDQRLSGESKNFNTRGGPRGFESNDGGGSHIFDNRSGGGHRGFDGREDTDPDKFDNRRYSGNSTIGDQGRFNEVAVRRSDGRDGLEAGVSGFNKQFEESFQRRAPTPPRNINWNDRKRAFPGDVNDGPPSSVLCNERNMNDFPRQLNIDDFNRRRSPQPNRNQRDFDQFGRGNDNQGAANIFNSKEQNFDRDHGRVGNINKQNMPVTLGGIIYANNMNRNQNNNNANLHPTSVRNAPMRSGSFGGNNANRPISKGDLRGSVIDRSRNKINPNPPNRSGAQGNNKVTPNDKVQSNRAVVANNNNRNKAAFDNGNIGRSNNSSQSVNVGRKGDSDGTNLKRSIQNQPNLSNMNSQRRNISQNSNIPNSSQSTGRNVERGSGHPSNNIPSLLNSRKIFGFGNRGVNDNFNNINGPFPGNNFGNDNYNNFEPMNVGGYHSNPGGFCIKSFKVNTNEKYFVNVCQTDEIPAPEDLTEEQLSEILNSEAPSNYRIPMSISEPRTTKDKSNNIVEVCDIAVNPKFFVKCKKSVLFKDFFLALIAEALSEKYNVQISIEKTIILATRKFIGSLVSHRVRNNDVQKVLESFQTPTEDDKAKLEHLEQSATSGLQRRLVQEIDGKEISTSQKFNEELCAVNDTTVKKEISKTNSHEPLYKLRAKIKDEKVDEIHAEFYLPKCITSQDITLDIGDDRILMESIKHGYIFDKFVNYRLNQQRARAIYDKTNKMLQLRVPVLTAE